MADRSFIDSVVNLGCSTRICQFMRVFCWYVGQQVPKKWPIRFGMDTGHLVVRWENDSIPTLLGPVQAGYFPLFPYPFAHFSSPIPVPVLLPVIMTKPVRS